ncbi:MAG: Cof-type HAD-IIB family hydrolase [Ignavibacteriales bacterium]|nr:Cof-type HAD-IIB family hydrolase [Ignavibacteriales bacterium]MCF8314996.1 Cof-type HAD-IIB family hydrolase [Ignavibacteriales bacterium]MCF8436008.1 Cof-type HAD-IIB family hydrolase [Ignavibacteriales bacterium]
MKTFSPKIVISDLDGTLLASHNKLSTENKASLEKLGRLDIKRVVATGRSYFSAMKVLPPDFPIDYLIFSSGAGIIDWKEKTLLRSYVMQKDQITESLKLIRRNRFDFMVHDPVPENHRFFYKKYSGHNPDFDRRVEAYRPFCSAFSQKNVPDKASQFVVIMPAEEFDVCSYFRANISDSSVIKTTSPLDNKSLWIEIFPGSVSKSQAAGYVCQINDLTKNDAVAIGNDTNDLDLLHWAGRAYAVNNAHSALAAHFPSMPSNDDHGFSHLIEKYFD